VLQGALAEYGEILESAEEESEEIDEIEEIEKAANAAFFRRTKCGAPPTAAERKWALPTVARGLGGVAPIGDGNCVSSFLANNKKEDYHERKT